MLLGWCQVISLWKEASCCYQMMVLLRLVDIPVVWCDKNMRPLHIVLFHVRVRTLSVLLLPHPFYFAMGWIFFYLPKLLRSINALPQTSLLWTFYSQDSCYRSTWPCPFWDRRVFSSLFFLCLCSLSPPSSYSHLWSCCESAFTFIHHWSPTLI